MENTSGTYVKQHPIECMFFGEFHHEQGPKITYQFPTGYLKREDSLYDCVMNYIIPKPELQQKIITINVESKKVVGCPVRIENSKYPRNEYVFNFGLIIDKAHKSSPCIPLIKQLSQYMTELELEQAFVSNELTKKEIPNILEKMFVDLNRWGECCTYVGEETVIYLKIFPPMPKPPTVRNHDVPVLCVNLDDYNFNDWDLTTQRILPFIDGFHHVLKISVMVDVDSQLTRNCIQDLAFYNIIKLTSVFQYSKQYAATPKLSSLIEDESLRESCINFVVRPGAPKPNLHDIMVLYCDLAPGVTVENLCQRHQSQLIRVCERKLIQFGVINGLIRQIQSYPLYTDENGDPGELHSLMDGTKSIEEICCNLAISTREFQTKCEKDRNVVICYK